MVKDKKPDNLDAVPEKFFGDETKYHSWKLDDWKEEYSPGHEDRYGLFSRAVPVKDKVVLIFYQKMMDQFRWELHFNKEHYISNIFKKTFNFIDNLWKVSHVVLALAIRKLVLDLCASINFFPLSLLSVPKSTGDPMKNFEHFATMLKINRDFLLCLLTCRQLSRSVAVLSKYEKHRISHDLKLVKHVGNVWDKRRIPKPGLRPIYKLLDLAFKLQEEFRGACEMAYGRDTMWREKTPIFDDAGDE